MKAAREEWLARATVLVGFALTRLAAAMAGLRFDATPLDYFAQLLDPPLLRDHLLESLWYLHAQPPLLNLAAGVALKLSPDHPGGPLQVLFLGAGLASCFALFGILRGLGAGRWPSAAAAVLLAATPPFLLHENVSFYPHLAQALILCAGWAFIASKGRPGPAMSTAFWLLAALVLLRSLFHPLYFLLAAGAAAALAPTRERTRVLRSTSLPVALVMLWGLKNLLLFGFFGTSSWGGNSFHHIVTGSIDRPVLEEMVEAGTLPPLSLEWEFSPPERFVEVLGIPVVNRGVRALDETGKTAESENPVNYNHWVYPIASREFSRAALRVIRERPRAYPRAIQWTSGRFLAPVTQDGIVLGRNRVRIPRAVRLTERIEQNPIYRLLLLAGLVGAIAAGLRRDTAPGKRMFLLFAAGTILWTAAIGIVMEFGENNRFRYPILGLTWILALAAGRSVVRAVARRFALGPSPRLEPLTPDPERPRGA